MPFYAQNVRKLHHPPRLYCWPARSCCACSHPLRGPVIHPAKAPSVPWIHYGLSVASRDPLLMTLFPLVAFIECT